MRDQWAKYFILICVMILGSCSDFLDLEPETSLSSAVALDNIEGVEAAINGTYSSMQQEWIERQIVFAECLASNVREVNTINNSNYQDAIRHQSWQDLWGTSNFLWRMCYRAIDLTNQVIRAVPDIADQNDQVVFDKRRLLGEALFLRGLNYFVLTRFYSDPRNGLSIPILTEPYNPEDLPARATIEEARAQVIADLLEAESLMDGITSNQGRATVYAVKAMLARAHFEYKDYNQAEMFADEVISAGRVDGIKLELLQGDLTTPFSSAISSENIFTFLANARDRANVRLFEMFSLQSSAVELSISDSFWDVIFDEPNDLRIKQLHEDFRVAHACYKYEDREMNIPYIRLPEMYLIRCESRINTGKVEEALNDLNVLRRRAALDPVETIDPNELLRLIFLERSVELSMEGDNLHNLRRLEMPIGGYSWEEASYKLVFFIPEKEVQLNSNLVQNDLW